MDGGRAIGAFAGMIVRKAGMKILGSPFPGWTTPYMGLSLAPGASRRQAVEALVAFAFGELGCVHLELMDRHLELTDVAGIGASHRMFNTSEVDLASDAETLIRSFSATCRRYIHKAARDGLVVEEARDDAFVDEYHDQLVDVFARQRLVPTYGRSRVRLLIKHVPARQLLLLRVRTPDGHSAATGIFHALDRQRVYFWGIASRQHLVHLHPNELLLNHAMNAWRERGFSIMDLGGGGAYKQKYHPRPTPVPWIRISKFPFIPPLREAARLSIVTRQRLLGRLARRPVPAPR
ncbi:MAG TPA: GNAT family N-acetyltransferase, partial [Candidatus Limnocylindrales bacterium]|nr:GNAT family N-acetyltransferase [Candidatus Limnocylindrales bacterium]